jgi:predicted nucleic acid-binding protein
VDFFRHGVGNVSDTVARLYNGGLAVLAGPVAAELLRGARGRKERTTLDNLFHTADWITVTDETWLQAGALGGRLREAGHTPGTVDLVLAAAAMEAGCSILTLDRHFEAIAAHSPLMLVSI